LPDFRTARLKCIGCFFKHDSGSRLSGRTGRVTGHCSDFLGAALRGFHNCLARFRRYGSDHRLCPPMEYSA
jgi:hypothetical protein